MKRTGRFLATFITITAFSCLAQTPDEETWSKDRKFSAEISSPEIGKPLVTVFKHNGETKSVFWARRLKVEEDNAEPDSIPKFVTSDGKTVILRPRYQNGNGPGVRVVTQGRETSLSSEDLSDQAESAGAQISDQMQFDGRVLELLVDADQPPMYALWFSGATNWVTVNLGENSISLASPALKKKLDTVGLETARDVARKYQPGGLKRMLAPLKRTAAEYLPGMAASAYDEWFSDEVAAAYRFIAAQKSPEDKKLIEALLTKDLENSTITGSFGVISTHASSSGERTLADELLSVWEGKAQPDDYANDSMTSHDPLHYLGRISGTVRLPFPPSKKQETVWLYLIPNHLSSTAWDKNKEVVKLGCELLPGMGSLALAAGSDNDAEVPSETRFEFDTLSPGEYRIKAVWDHRGPFPTPGKMEPVKPEAGDYESPETQVVKVAAGQEVAGLILECTNRVGNAPALFAEDDQWKAKHPPIYSNGSPENDGFSNWTEKVLFTAPIEKWAIETNKSSELIRLQKISLIEEKSYSSRDKTKKVTVKFRSLNRGKESGNSNYEGYIVDDHGCRFSTGGSSSNGRNIGIDFNPFPYGSKTMTLQIVEQEFASNGAKTNLLASLLLTNLFQITPAVLKPETIPARRKLDLVTVELASFNTPGAIRRGAADEGEDRDFQVPQFRYYDAKGETHVWKNEMLICEDRWGNTSFGAHGFCREEKVFKVKAQFARDFELAQFSDEERWEIPVEKIPGPGEARPLKLKKEFPGITVELLSIGGTGEFSYNGGELISATDQIKQESRSPRQFPNLPGAFAGRAPEPKVYLKNQNNYLPGVNMSVVSTSNDLVARVPHLVYRVILKDSLIQHELLDELQYSDSSPFSHHVYMAFPNSPNQMKYVALRFRSGETNQKLTFLVQKPREAEFIVERSK